MLGHLRRRSMTQMDQMRCQLLTRLEVEVPVELQQRLMRQVRKSRQKDLRSRRMGQTPVYCLGFEGHFEIAVSETTSELGGHEGVVERYTFFAAGSSASLFA